jgi:signal transduction histidine kinase
MKDITSRIVPAAGPGKARVPLTPDQDWRHAVQFASGERFPAGRVASFLVEGLRAGEPAVVIAGTEHQAAILGECAQAGWDVTAARAASMIMTLDAEQVLSWFMRGGAPEASLFEAAIGSSLARLSAGAIPLRVCSELEDPLWRRGETVPALALEDLWNDLLARLPLRLMCIYPIDVFEGEAGVRDFRHVCSRHESVWPAEDHDAASPLDAGRLLAELQLRSRHVRVETERRRGVEVAERETRGQLEAAHERLERLQSLTSALCGAVTQDDVGTVVVSDMMSALGATQAMLAVPVPEEPHTLRVLVHGGSTSGSPFGSRTFATDEALPAAEAYRSGLPVWITSAAELSQRYPRLSPAAACAVVCLPIGVAGRRLGVAGFGFSAERTVFAMDRALMRELAQQVALALERARLYEAARRSEARLHEANRRKEEFLALLGHELRNPLAPIVTALELMKLRGDTTSLRERELIERQVRHLNRLVDDLLDVSRITRGKLELKKTPLELSALLSQALELVSPLVEQRRHRLSVEAPRDGVWIEADAARFAKVLANLLTNAAKFTDPGGEIAVRVAREGGHALITVKDNGVGIRPQMLSRVFEPFVQVDRSVEGARGGLGLGLALVKSLVKLHGGEVEASSEGPGRGSEFRIRVPSAVPLPPRQDRAFASQPRIHPSAARRVLVVDDNQDAADGLAEMLATAGHQAHVAYDAAAALLKARALELDAAVLDVQLPALDGYELARRIRELPGGSAIRFVAVSGFGTSEDERRSRSAGFAGHLVKPIDFQQLLNLLEHPRD